MLDDEYDVMQVRGLTSSGNEKDEIQMMIYLFIYLFIYFYSQYFQGLRLILMGDVRCIKLAHPSNR